MNGGGADTEYVLQRRVVGWQEALQRKGLKVNAKKTEVMVCTREVSVEADISDKEKDRLKQGDTFNTRRDSKMIRPCGEKE